MTEQYKQLKQKAEKVRIGHQALSPRGHISIGNVPIGDNKFVVFAGPCSVESQEQLLTISREIKLRGASGLRGGCFKPRTNPYSFQGLGIQAVELMNEVGKSLKLPIVTEVMDPRDVEVMQDKVDMFQIGSRNMQNFTLLKEVGRSRVPVLLKRGLHSTLEEFIFAAEYILKEGNLQVVLCERGIRSFDTTTRNVLDLSAVPILKSLTSLPVIVDPSHATGIPFLISPMSMAAAACGADGIIVEVHHQPQHALSDGDQALTPSQFSTLIENLKPILRTLDKEISYG